MRQLLFLFTLLIVSFELAYAGLDEGVSAYERGDYSTAYEEFFQLANDGDSTAQYNLGLLYEQGLGVQYNRDKAVSWYTAAAEGGHSDAQLIIGDLFIEGYWGEEDFIQASEWYRLAAEQSLAEAQRKLGILYALGQGVARDLTNAAYWLGAAAEGGDKEAAEWLRKLKFDRPPGSAISIPIPADGTLTPERCRDGFPELYSYYEVDVSFEFEPARLHHNRSIAELGKAVIHGSGSRVLGATATKIGVQPKVQYKAVPMGDTTCFWVHSIDVILRPSALDVYIAREYKKGSCPYNVILDHEREHVRVVRNTLERFTTSVRSALASPLIPTALNPEVAVSPEAAKDRVETVVSRLIEPVVEVMEREYRKSQASLDTPKEYKRLRRRCSRW
jgi:TPR repeat protein